jgi:hypothetical protein
MNSSLALYLNEMFCSQWYLSGLNFFFNLSRENYKKTPGKQGSSTD